MPLALLQNMRARRAKKPDIDGVSVDANVRAACVQDSPAVGKLRRFGLSYLGVLQLLYERELLLLHARDLKRFRRS